MAASKRANGMPSAFVARQSLNDEELVSRMNIFVKENILQHAKLFVLRRYFFVWVKEHYFWEVPLLLLIRYSFDKNHDDKSIV